MSDKSNHDSSSAYATVFSMICDPFFFDIKFWVFSRRITSRDGERTRVDKPVPVYASSTVLNQTDYFRTMLSSGFNEGASKVRSDSGFPRDQKPWEDAYDYESDSDLDEEEYDEWEDEDTFPELEEARSGDCGGRYREIVIRDSSVITWRVLMQYLHTGRVSFTSLRSCKKAECQDSARSSLNPILGQPVLPKCSPKSMYRLANKMDLKPLEALAQDAIKHYIRPSNILPEIFSDFTSRYDSVLNMQIVFLCSQFHHAEVVSQWPSYLKRLAQGDLPHAETMMTILLSQSLTPRARPPTCSTPQIPSPQTPRASTPPTTPVLGRSGFLRRQPTRQFTIS